jgi:hypothetical protein
MLSGLPRLIASCAQVCAALEAIAPQLQTQKILEQVSKLLVDLTL